MDDALSSLTEAFEQREKELNEREEKLREDEEKLREDEERFKAERTLAYGETTPSDVLHLNVGGTKTTVLRRTLTVIPGSMLASKFSGRWDEGLEKDKDGDFFIDQDFSLFSILLNYLRNRANGDANFPFESPKLSEDQYERRFDLFRMVDYYGMTDGMYPTKLYPQSNPAKPVEMVGPKKAIAKNLYTRFQLAPDGHSRRIKAFEVTLGEVEKVRMGWNVSDNGESYSDFVLDLSRSLFVEKKHPDNPSKKTPVNGLKHTVGTVVLSKDCGRLWYVNGQLVVDASKRRLHSCKVVPFLFAKGEFEITSVELGDDCPNN